MPRPPIKKIAPALLAVLLLVAGGLAFRHFFHRGEGGGITLYGNVDIRQIHAAFQDSGRLLSLNVQEGDAVRRGQVLAELDPVRFRDASAQARAQAAYQEQVLARLLAGSRPEEIREARAEVAAAKASLDNAVITLERQTALARRNFVPKQNIDNAQAAEKTARANWERADQALQLAIQGPRKEDIAAARQALDAAKAASMLADRQLADTRLLAPEDGIVQDRILEPGDMASPQTPVVSLALDNPVWIRAYLSEKDMGRVKPGMAAWVTTDSFPGHRFEGWVGFISPTAEFTPKNVETPELRTELMYRVRVYVCNPDHRLRLGMPATVAVPLQEPAASPGDGAHSCGK